MEVSGEQRIAASRTTVWNALNNPNVLRKCIPGCKSMERKSPHEMEALVKLKLGFLSASFKGNVTLTNVIPMQSYTMISQGSGGLAGSAKSTTDVTLREENGETIVSYTMHGEVGGRLAAFGSSLIDASFRKLAAQFFEKLGRIIVSGAEAAAGATNPSEG